MKTISRLTALVALCAVFSHSSPADAANILWLDSVNTTSNSGAGRDPELTWVDLLVTKGGHTLTTFDATTYQWSLADQASRDYVNSFDLVIATRTNNLFNTIRLFGTNWKTVSAPMIEMNPFMVGGQFSSGTWNWLESGTGSAAGSANVASAVADPNDPIWNGITLLAGGTQAPNLFGGGGGNWFGLNGNPLRNGISVVASNPSNSDQILIAYAAPGALSPTSGPRYYFNWGPDQLPVQYNADGQQAFLNAISILTIPEPSRALLFGLGLLALLRRGR